MSALSFVRRRSRAFVVPTGAVLLAMLLPATALAQPPDPAKDELPRDALVLESLQKRQFVPEKASNVGLERIGVEAPVSQAEPPTGTATPPKAESGAVDFGAPLQQTAHHGDGTTAASVFLGGATSTTTAGLEPAGRLPVRLGQAPGAAAPAGTWQVSIADRADPLAKGVDGALLTVTAPAAGSVPVAVQLDYKAYQNYYGADWASRLRFVQFPECYLTTPEVEACRTYKELETENDTKAKSITATVDTAADGTVTPAAVPNRAPSATSGVMRASYVKPAATAAAAGGDRAVLGAVDSGAGVGGSFKATPLISNGQWAAGGSSGAFTWSYPIEVPPSPAGPAPKIALGYNSQAVDGKTATSSPQASWVGEGWDYDPGSIQRRYRTCKDDTKKVGGRAPNNEAKASQTSDLCWVSYNAVMSLGGKTVELVRAGATNEYRPKEDDGTRVRLKTDTDNDDNDNEYWEVTTRDGTRYFYGLNRIGGGHDDTHSVFTVPVFGNHPDEPCNAPTFAASRCGAEQQQAWQWGLDKVIDVHGNVMIVNWAPSPNYYAVNEKTERPEKYIRGGLPSSIEYGLRDDNLGATPSAKINFHLAERCLEGGAICNSGNFDKPDPAAYRYWWDVPGNLNCKSTSKLCPQFPSFWTQLRLGKIETYAHRPGTTGLQLVDTYVLNHSFPRNWYDTSPGLWLNSIARYGYLPGTAAGTPMSKSGVSFKQYVVGKGHPLQHLIDQQLPNLVPRDANDSRPGFKRPRIGGISTEHGGDIEVIYRGGCKVQPTVAPENNHNECYPTRWSPDGEEKLPQLAWFNKYVVDKVIETDRITTFSPRVVTKYAYANAAWGKSDDEFTKPDLRTYSEWRGYQTVTTIKGNETKSSNGADPETQSYGVTRYFRGAGGVVKDSIGSTVLADDQPQYAGQVAETITYDGADNRRVLSRTLSKPWSVQTASRARDGGAGDLLAHRVGVKQTDTFQTVGTSWQAVRTETEFDPKSGLPVQTQTSVVKPNGTGETLSDQTCTKTEYADNPTIGLIGLTKSVRATATSCADYGTADPGTQLLSDARTTYDNLEYEAAPVKGDVTGLYEIDGTGTSRSVVTTMQYDSLGRMTKVTKPLVGTTETRYTPATGGPVTSITTINPKKHSNTSTFDPGRGLALTVTDANGRTARNEYDAFGRLVKGWSPARSAGSQAPDVQISYQLADASTSVTKPSAVTVQSIKDDGTYAKQVTIYDGLMRPVQTQSQAHGPGRVVTDTRYNDHGLAWEQTSAYLAKGEPATQVFERQSDTLVPSLRRTFYDGLERPVRVATYHGMEFLNNESTKYDDTTTYHRPAGVSDPATKTFTDALGRVVKVLHYTSANTYSTASRATTYEYDARGNQSKTTDPAGNVWTRVFDARRRVVSSTDPDTGTTDTTYDAADRPVTVSNKRGSVHTSYDELSRVTATREGSASASPVTSFTYDTLPGALGLPVSSTRHDASGDYVDRVTGYDVGYRPTGRETVIPANAMTTGVSGTYAYAFTYTPTGSPLTATLPAKGGLAAEKLVTRYNEDGLPESTSGATWYTADVTYSPYGEPLRTVTGPQPHRVWTTNFLHNNTGQLQRTVVHRETPKNEVSDTRYSYDYAGKITSIGQKATDPTTGAITNDNQCFTYDAMGELVHAWTSNVAAGSGGAACMSSNGSSWGYRADGKAIRGPVADAPDTVSDTTAPDTALTNSLAAASPVPGTVSGGTLGYWDSYTFDLIGNRAKLTVHNPADATKDVTRTYGYGIEVPGNGTQPPAKKQPHALANVNSTAAGENSSYQYDSAGNTTDRVLPAGAQQLTWNQQNKLTEIKNAGVTTKYVYDASGNRLLENTPTGSVLYLGETELTTAAGKITRATRAYSHPGAPTVLRSTVNGATTGHKLDVLVSDHLGTSNTMIAMADGQAVTRRAFKPYGEARGAKTAWPNRRTYLGVGIDDPSGLTHIGAREYDQSTGRFISVDPILDIADPLQMNGYAYSNNSPISSADPSGLFCDGCSANNENSVWTPDHGPGCTTQGCYDTDGDYLYNPNTSSGNSSSTAQPQKPTTNVKVTKDSHGNTFIEGTRQPTAVELQARYPMVPQEQRYQKWAQHHCEFMMFEGGFCAMAEGTGLVTSEQSPFDKAVTGIIVGVVAPDFDAWKGCATGPNLSDCGSAALDLPFLKALKGLKITYKVAKKADDLCEPNSFLPGTLVLMGDGTAKPIEDIEAGDEVLATDPETGETRVEKVVTPLKDTAKKKLVRVTIDTDGDRGDETEQIVATQGHPFWVPQLGEWLEATNLIAGQTLSSAPGVELRVASIQRWTEHATVHNLTVANLHTYYALAGTKPVLVHNSNKKCPTGVANSDAPKPLGRGSTGDTVPRSLQEQIAMKQAMSDPANGFVIPLKKGMTDPRWQGSDGWQKMSKNIDGIEIHYVYNPRTGQVDDYKFKR